MLYCLRSNVVLSGAASTVLILDPFQNKSVHSELREISYKNLVNNIHSKRHSELIYINQSYLFVQSSFLVQTYDWNIINFVHILLTPNCIQITITLRLKVQWNTKQTKKLYTTVTHKHTNKRLCISPLRSNIWDTLWEGRLCSH